MLQQEVLLKHGDVGSFQILKSDDLVIGGYASIEVVDKQNDLITIPALDEAVNKFMGENSYRNVMSNHSNVQVGEVIEQYRDNNGTLHKTGVDDVGFYVVIKLRDDIEKAKEISRGIRKGTLRSFSIGGQAISKKSRTSAELGRYNEIDKLELHEVTICEKGINPEAKFDILKSEVEEKMSEELEKSITELNSLLTQITEVRKAEEETDESNVEAMEKGEYEAEEPLPDEQPAEETEEAPDTEEMSDDGAEKALDKDLDVEAGKLITEKTQIDGATVKGDIVDGYGDRDFTTLNLSNENVEKAYEAYKAEQLEKLAFDNLSKQFASRFETEMSVKKAAAERADYDAQEEVATLRTEFEELRKSISAKNDEIRKTQEVAFGLPEGFPTSIEEMADLSWTDVHSLVGVN